MISPLGILLLPRNLQDLRSVLNAMDWHALGATVEQETQARLVILGPVNSGKSTLFNHLHGQTLSAVSAVPGTTQGAVEQPLGPFVLIDTPGFGEVWGVDRAAIAREAAASAHLVLLVLDAAAGVRQSDHDLYTELKRMGKPVVVALNKSDLIKSDLPWVLENAEAILGAHPIPIAARTGLGITDKLFPAILAACPEVGVAMAHALPAARRQLVQRLIGRAAWGAGLIAMEPLPGLDVPLLLAAQTRLVLRIAAAYGQPMNVSHARELLTTMAGSLLTRYLGGQLAKFVPGPGWIVSGVIAGISTWAIGEAARRYFEAEGKLAAPAVRDLYQQMRKLAPRWLLRRNPQKETENVAPTQ